MDVTEVGCEDGS